MCPSPTHQNRGTRRLLAAVSATLLLVVLTPSVMAEPPSFFNKLFRKKAPAGPLELKVENGPWLIMAMIISDGDAQKQANDLALELRETLRMPTFVMQRSTGTQQHAGGQRERIRTDARTGVSASTTLEARYVHGGVTEGFAVLVGEFTSLKDPQVEETLQKLRTLQPESLTTPQISEGDEAPSSNWMVQKYRELNWSRTDRNDGLGPMGRAFATRNPLLPAEYFLDTPELDSFVTKLNKDVEHSLLDCPGKYTVRVATFTGKETTGFGATQASIDEPTNVLDRAALRAHQLTDLLRKKGVEAYEFHDKYGSYVSIGHFDSLGSESNGQFQYNPAMAAIAQQYCGYRDVYAENPITKARMKTTSLNYLGKIPFDLEGKPMAVPRPAASVYGGSLLGRK